MIQFEPLEVGLWGESMLSMRYMAIGPGGQMTRWPDSRIRRTWMRLRGWQFFEDSVIESQRRLNWLRSATYEAPVEWMSLAEVKRRYPAP